MSETYRPVKPKISGGRRLPRPARATVLFAGILVLMVLIVAAVQASRAPTSSAQVAGASAAPTADAPGTAASAAPDPARAAKGDRVRLGRAIRITGITGDQVDLATDDGWRRTITVTPTTKLSKGDQTISLADLTLGDQVRISQRREDDGSYVITAIRVVVPMTVGRVSAIDADSMTLLRRGASQEVRLTAGTSYRVGKATGTKADVVVGAVVVVQGTQDGTTFTATSVNVQPARRNGTVTAVAASTITIERRDGTKVVVHVDADTVVRVRGKGVAAASDIKVGDRLEVRGALRADGGIDADRIQARTPKAKPKSSATAAP